MIWDNFSFFKANCAILTSYIRVDPSMCRGFSCGFCHVPWSNGENWDFFPDFSRWWQGIRQRRRTGALLCTFMLWVNRKGEFFRVKNYLISRCELVISARASCMFVLYREFMKENSANLWVSYYFCSFCEFAKVFEREVWRVRVAHYICIEQSVHF